MDETCRCAPIPAHIWFYFLPHFAQMVNHYFPPPLFQDQKLSEIGNTIKRNYYVLIKVMSFFPNLGFNDEIGNFPRFVTPVLEPDFDLSLRETQFNCQLGSLFAWQVSENVRTKTLLVGKSFTVFLLKMLVLLAKKYFGVLWFIKFIVTRPGNQ